MLLFYNLYFFLYLIIVVSCNLFASKNINPVVNLIKDAMIVNYESRVVK